MSEERQPGAPGEVPGSIDTRAAWNEAVVWALQAALARSARRILLVDPDFAHWPLGEPAVLALLQAFVRMPQRQLLLMASNFDEVPRKHPRFVAWRRDWAHAVSAWTPPEGAAALPGLLLDDGPVLLQRLSLQPLRARAALDPAEARRWREQTDAFLQQSSPAFPAHTLGL